MNIGVGSAYSGDRLQPALALAEAGVVDYLCFDRLADRTLALAQARKLDDPRAGHDEEIARVFGAFGRFLQSDIRLIGNFGGANVEAAVSELLSTLNRDGANVRIGAVYGDDVLDQVLNQNVYLPELDVHVKDIETDVISANAYIGAEPIIECLDAGARGIIGGRIADASLFVAPICWELGIGFGQWNELGLATVAGHLLECGVQVSGGHFADPPFRMVPGLDDLGAPWAEMVDMQSFKLKKLHGSGGLLSRDTARLQLGYEIHDPKKYLTPDVTADFSAVSIRQIGEDEVLVEGACGSPPTDSFRVLVGVDMGWKAIGRALFGGAGCVTRARLAQNLIETRLAETPSSVTKYKCDLIGLDALSPRTPRGAGPEPNEVELRVAIRARTLEDAREACLEAWYCAGFGVSGGCGFDLRWDRSVGVTPTLLPKELVNVRTEVIESPSYP